MNGRAALASAVARAAAGIMPLTDLGRSAHWRRAAGGVMRFATDTGGTFTDLLVENEGGRVHMFKAPTVPSEPVKGVLDAFDLAAREF